MRNFRREVAAASESPVELPETEFSWSLTRHLRFLHCERGYFLHYYAAQGGWDRYADSVAAAVYRGKKTLLLPEWLEERMDRRRKDQHHHHGDQRAQNQRSLVHTFNLFIRN